MSDLAVPEGRIGTIITRLHALYPRLIDISLGRIERLLTALGSPERRLPPVLHVAGTNVKGSTCAFAQAIGEAAGMRVHVTTSPHLVRINERFRIAGELVSDDELERTLDHIEHVNGGEPITVFEVLIAAAFTLFAEHPAELCVVEVGLGGRGDATNVLARPAACAITSISLDHRDFLGDTVEQIAAEKAGIMKPGVPVVVGAQPQGVRDVLRESATEVGATLLLRDRDWQIEERSDGLRFTDRAGSVDLPPPSLPGTHQHDNAGIAVAALRTTGLAIPDHALATGIARAEWPARLQRLHGGLAQMLPRSWELWLDGGHNPGAGVALAQHLRGWRDRPLHLVIGMKRSKDATEFLRPLLASAASVWAVAEPGQHLALPVEAIVAASGGVARPGPTARDALAHIAAEINAAPSRVLICGSLYLAGEILKADAA
ncbi:MAG: bifunctional folylpolyglutamate synthase/dihydrofolate synthase [Acidisphaera sp.]|nr:bifunctional folylpolyglutamate synthase/dihydrofolate synthase [Acidisphaera sp.]